MNKNKSYKCIKSFEIPILDENGSCTDDFLIIKKNALFNFEGSNTLCGADFKLTNDDNFIEINSDKLKSNFVEVKQVKKC